MIANTAHIGYFGQDSSLYYIPPDPKYIHYDSPASLYHHDAHHNLETGFANDGGIEGLFKQSEEIIDSKIDMLYQEMGNRAALKDKNIYHINLDQCSCQNLINQMGEHSFDNKRLELERKIIDLEQEKRREEAALSKDLMFLNKELRMARIEELEEKQKRALCMPQEAIT